MTGEREWLELLRALDEPGELGQAAGLEFPRDVDWPAIQQRYERLAARLSDVFGCPLAAGKGPYQDAALFGEIQIPPEFTKTRAKRTRIRFPVIVAVSNFGNLAACWPGGASPPPLHPEDLSRVVPVLDELGYLFVPAHVLEGRYDGPNQWVFSGRDETWLDRYFSVL